MIMEVGKVFSALLGAILGFFFGVIFSAMIGHLEKIYIMFFGLSSAVFFGYIFMELFKYIYNLKKSKLIIFITVILGFLAFIFFLKIIY